MKRSGSKATKQKTAGSGIQAIRRPEVHAPWNFHERVEKGRNEISRWISAAQWSPKTRANFDRTLDHLKALPKTAWHKPHPASTIGNHIYVIRFKDTSSKQLRVFGHFFESHHAFVMTFDGYEKDDVYYPENYQDVAQHHRTACNQDFSGRTVAFEQYCRNCPTKRSGQH